MTPLDLLRQDLRLFDELLTARRAVTTVTLPAGARLLWGVYLIILEDGHKTLRGLVEFLER